MSQDIHGKLMTVEEAVRRFVRSGSQVALGGFTVNRNPMLLSREIIRQGVKDLHLVVHSQGQALDLLIGAGSAARLEIAYGGNGRFAPTCLRFKKAVVEQDIEVEDYSNFQMSLRFLAGALDLPFIPSRTGLATDLIRKQGFGAATRAEPKVSNRKTALIGNPFSEAEEQVLLLPALNPDVALLHAQYVADDGTVRIKGLTFADIEQAQSARHVLVSCEEIVPAAWLRQDPDQNTLPSFLIDAVVKAPWGAHPTACHMFYDYDPRHLHLYRRAASDDRRFQSYLQEWVYDLPDQKAYLEKVGSAATLAVKANPATGYAVGLDRR